MPQVLHRWTSSLAAAAPLPGLAPSRTRSIEAVGAHPRPVVAGPVAAERLERGAKQRPQVRHRNAPPPPSSPLDRRWCLPPAFFSAVTLLAGDGDRDSESSRRRRGFVLHAGELLDAVVATLSIVDDALTVTYSILTTQLC
jgi:hypothetical protein